jgi:APA family basic amino acid/polyamine antiporter
MGEKGLKRTLGLGITTLFCIGLILGAGIYALIGGLAAYSGAFMWFPLLLSCLLSICAALTYAEFVSMYPKSASAFVYLEKGIGRGASAVLSWVWVFVALPLSGAVITLSFAFYFTSLVSIPSVYSILLVTFVALILLTILNWVGITESAGLAGIMMFVEAAGLVLIILLGAFYGTLTPDYTAASPIFGSEGVIIGLGISGTMFAGYELMGSLSEETKNPERTIPKAIVIAMLTVGALYIGVSLAITRLLSVDQLALTYGTGGAPLVEAAKTAFGGSAYPLFWFIGCFATFNSALAVLVVDSRIMYGMAEEKVLPHGLLRMSQRRRTPTTAILISTVFVAVYSLLGSLDIIVRSAIMAGGVVSILVCVSLIIRRIKDPKMKRPFKVPLNIGRIPIPTVLAIIGISLVIFIFTMESYLSWIPFLVILAVGAVFYIVSGRKK